MNIGFSIRLLAGVAASIMVGLAAQAADTLSNPTSAEKKEHLASVLRAGSYVKSGKPACLPALDEIEKGNVTFIAPDGFGESEMPQALRDLGKECPNLNLGMQWYTGRDHHLPVTAASLTKIYGEPFRATRNFTLYNIPFASGIRPVFVAEQNCREGECYGGGWLTLIDQKRCVTEDGRYFGRYEGSPPTLIPGAMNGVVKIGEDYFFLETNNLISKVSIFRITEDANPKRKIGTSVACYLESK